MFKRPLHPITRRAVLESLPVVTLAPAAFARDIHADPGQVRARVDALAHELMSLLWSIAPERAARLGVTISDGRSPDPHPGLSWGAESAECKQIGCDPRGRPFFTHVGVQHLNPKTMRWG